MRPDMNSRSSSSAKWASVEDMKLDILQITLVRVRTFLGEDVIPFTPNQQCWGLVDAKIFLPLWIKRWVGPIAVKQLELDFFVARTVKQKLVVKPVIR